MLEVRSAVQCSRVQSRQTPTRLAGRRRSRGERAVSDFCWFVVAAASSVYVWSLPGSSHAPPAAPALLGSLALAPHQTPAWPCACSSSAVVLSILSLRHVISSHLLQHPRQRSHPGVPPLSFPAISGRDLRDAAQPVNTPLRSTPASSLLANSKTTPPPPSLVADDSLLFLKSNNLPPTGSPHPPPRPEETAVHRRKA
ncbi:hypothetical protein BC567DRAFT_220087 [Phyllosticta citribraziliensis]